MTLFTLLLDGLLWVLGIYLALNCGYLLFFAVAGHLNQPRVTAPTHGTQRRRPARTMCVLIPAYRENTVILETTRAALRHAYSGGHAVCVIADGLQPETVAALREMGAQVLEVHFERSTKGKALLYALEALPQHQFEVAMVLDVDNIMSRGCLEAVNQAFEAGYQVVQTHRTAKNTDSAFALLDACNEEINNHIYRKGHFAVGLSAALIGSGMAFEFGYLRQLLMGIGETVGEDKELDFRIARDQEKICYLDHVYVYDEKVENAQVFTQQRSRWLAAQFEFLKKYAAEGLEQLMEHDNFEFFNKVVQAFLVPRMLLIGVLGMLLVVSAGLSFVLPAGPSPLFWAGLLTVLGLTLLASLPARLYNKQLLTAIVRLPYALLCMVLALLRINRSKTAFLATPHRVQTLDASMEH
ncbi:glycosyltransferase family 2 protein [Hymenobacter sublimis]|uniref:Glycosyltransferase n=1 Tax=Hymenobacter sublimis TaxID=2933777 RepID=A0ABY4JHS9_9BACT|nr:glycosyltransferase family 2 protein [Hymenobacter sublimis]UPL50879.1 glycosyltransferase [Hymenobacter sublimis]